MPGDVHWVGRPADNDGAVAKEAELEKQRRQIEELKKALQAKG